MIVHELFDPYAEHPVVNKNICFGGGGGTSAGYQTANAPTVPDYSQYISAMTNTGNTLQGYGADLYNWAQNAGVNLASTANQVSGQAASLAGQAGQQYTSNMANWQQTYGPLYQAQAADAERLIGNLPQTQEEYAGKYQADVAQAFDASKASNTRQLESYGLKAPGSGASQLDAMVSNQRGLAQVAAGEQGRLAARTEARQVTGQALQAGLAFPGVANQAASTELAAGNQQIGAPESAISTTTGAYAPYLASYNASYPFMNQWGSTMATGYNQALGGYSAMNADKQAAYTASEKANQGSGIGSLLGGIAGTVAGSAAGPVGSAIGGKIGGMFGSAVGGAAGGAAGGKGEDFAAINNGENFVDPSASPSRGAIEDDVPARLNAGEFVWPKDVVAWRGEQWLQKEVTKARKERDSQTVAEPEMAPAGAIDMHAPPTFRSEGARA